MGPHTFSCKQTHTVQYLETQRSPPHSSRASVGYISIQEVCSIWPEISLMGFQLTRHNERRHNAGAGAASLTGGLAVTGFRVKLTGQRAAGGSAQTG